jgi:hypothetical protein
LEFDRIPSHIINNHISFSLTAHHSTSLASNNRLDQSIYIVAALVWDANISYVSLIRLDLPNEALDIVLKLIFPGATLMVSSVN